MALFHLTTLRRLAGLLLTRTALLVLATALALELALGVTGTGPAVVGTVPRRESRDPAAAPGVGSRRNAA